MFVLVQVRKFDVMISEKLFFRFLKEFEVKNTLGEGEFVFEALNRFDRCRYAVKRIAVDTQ